MNNEQEITVIEDSEDDKSDWSDGFCTHGLKLSINRAPKVLSRPRFHRGGIGNKQSKEQKECKISIINQIKEMNIWPDGCCRFEEPLSVTIRLYIARPLKDFINGQRSGGLKSTIANWYRRPKKRGDIDNYAKLYLDVMNGIVYKDDSQIYHLEMFLLPDDDGAGRVEIDVKGWRPGRL